jgi:hypothetical protein
VLARVAGHVEGGPNHLVACVRTVEARMADAARLLREGTASPRRLDAALARDLGLAFADAARLAPSLVPDALRAAARALTDSSADAGAG